MLKIEDNSYKPITTLKGHSAGIRCLIWNSSKQMLFSGGFDKMIICWDIGGKKGTAYELQGHQLVCPLDSSNNYLVLVFTETK